MTFCPLTELLVKRAIDDFAPKSVWDFGNQRYTGKSGFKTTEEFYAANGVDYCAIDINERMGSVIGDLNSSLRSFSQRDMVVNNGTSEHLFNQHSVFENAHNMSRRVIVHLLPFTPWINHGFFNYNPILFRDVAAANGYRLPVHWIGNRWGQYVDFSGDPSLYVEKNPTFMDKLTDVPQESGYFNAVIMEKTGDGEFRTPLQGKYIPDIESEEIKRSYGRSGVGT